MLIVPVVSYHASLPEPSLARIEALPFLLFGSMLSIKAGGGRAGAAP